MQLFLLRHAIAEPRDPARHPDDSRRPLTLDGRQKMTQAARGMRALGLRFDLILTSPLARAAATAGIVAREAGGRRRPRPCPALAPGGDTAGLLAALSRRPGAGSILAVGHEPDLSRIVSELLLASGGRLPVVYKKGALCRIDFEGRPQPGAGRLVFFLPPRLLRAAAGAS